MEKRAIANASSIIFLAKLDIINLARNVFDSIILPKEVVKELFDKKSSENEIIKRYLGNFLIEAEVKEVKDLSIGEGEKAAISLCLEKDIMMFISDDKKARSYARNLGIEVVGVLGILLYNYKVKKIDKNEIKTLLNKLIGNGYYLSPELYAEVLKRMEEG